MGSSPALPALPSPCPCHTGARDLGLAAGLSLWQVLRWAQVLEEVRAAGGLWARSSIFLFSCKYFLSEFESQL